MLKDLVHSALLFIEGLGAWGIMLGLMIEIIPSEIVLAFGGYLVAKGEVSPLVAVIFGTIGGTLAQLFVYWLGRYGGRPFLERYGKFIFINKHHIDVSENWFNKYGTGVIFTARFIPVVRHAISIPAGMARMPVGQFLLYTTLAVIPWSILFVYLGYTLGANWEQIGEKSKPYVVPFIILSVTLTVLYVLFQLVKRKKAKKSTSAYDEKKTAELLKTIGGEYRVLNGSYVQAGASSQKFDHIVIGPNGVFYIDMKHGQNDVPLNELGQEGSKNSLTAQLYRYEHVLKELFRSAGVQPALVGILCFTHPNSNVTGKSPSFTALKLDKLVAYIRTYKSPKPPLASSDIDAIERLIIGNSGIDGSSSKK